MAERIKIFYGIDHGTVEKIANRFAKDYDLEIRKASLIIRENPIIGSTFFLTVVYGKEIECVETDSSDTIHAKWEISSDGYYPYCSNCKNEPQGREMTKWCPNCGAKMDKE